MPMVKAGVTVELKVRTQDAVVVASDALHRHFDEAIERKGRRVEVRQTLNASSLLIAMQQTEQAAIYTLVNEAGFELKGLKIVACSAEYV